MIYSWHQKTWQQLINAFIQEKLPNTLLFSGAAGIGKSLFTMTFVRFIICKKRNQNTFCEAPDFCHDCHLINNQLHPAVYQIASEKGHPIKIDQIREMTEYIANTPFKSKYQCVIIHHAENLNEFAANALLKTLEEPAKNVFIFLISDEKSRLLKTILSRVLQINLFLPATKLALDWLAQQINKPQNDLELVLKLAKGAPLKALELLQSDYLSSRQLVYHALENLLASPHALLPMSDSLQEIDEEIVNELLLSFITDLAKLKVKVDLHYLNNIDYLTLLDKFNNARTLPQINHTMSDLNKIYHSLKRGTHLNKTLSIEYMLSAIITTKADTELRHREAARRVAVAIQ